MRNIHDTFEIRGRYLPVLFSVPMILPLSVTLIKANLYHSTLIYLALIYKACKFSERRFILTWIKDEANLCEDM